MRAPRPRLGSARHRSGFFRAWLMLKGWGWGPHAQCEFATLPVGNHGWERTA